MATVDITTLYEGGNKVIYHITATAADSAAEQSLMDISGIVGPDGVTGSGYGVLTEAAWSINRGYDNVKLYYHDETNDEVILLMSGDGSYNATGFGGGTIDIEASTRTEDDYDVLFDVVEHTDEVAAAAADITLVFKKRLTGL